MFLISVAIGNRNIKSPYDYIYSTFLDIGQVVEINFGGKNTTGIVLGCKTYDTKSLNSKYKIKTVNKILYTKLNTKIIDYISKFVSYNIQNFGEIVAVYTGNICILESAFLYHINKEKFNEAKSDKLIFSSKNIKKKLPILIDFLSKPYKMRELDSEIRIDEILFSPSTIKNLLKIQNDGLTEIMKCLFIKSDKSINVKNDQNTTISNILINSGFDCLQLENKNPNLMGIKNLFIKSLQDVIKLNQDQQGVYLSLCGKMKITKDDICTTIKEGNIETNIRQKTCVLIGKTGSGKTYVYLKYVLDKIIDDISAGIYNGEYLILAPEIALARSLHTKIKTILNDIIDVYFYSSSMSVLEKEDIKSCFVKKCIKIIIGTRSALFLPFNELRTIIVDEEHDSSFKQSSRPIYHGRDMAILLANIFNASVILSSATPSVETYFNIKSGKYEFVNIKSAFFNNEKKSINLVQYNIDEKEFISLSTINKINEMLLQKKQVMIYVNKRGFSRSLICSNKSCDFIYKCTECEANFIFHKKKNIMICHQCGLEGAKPCECSKCKSEMIFSNNFGIEKYYEDVKNIFLDYKISLISSDIIGSIKSYDLIDNIHSGETDIVVCTQILSKGHDFKNVGLVVVPAFESYIHDGDFRQNERFFQALVQIIGRSGRAEDIGSAIIEFVKDDSRVEIYNVIKNDKFFNFYENELSIRSNFHFKLPPFVTQTIIFISAIVQNDALITADDLFLLIKKSTKNLSITEPMPCNIFMIAKKYRYKMIIRHEKSFAIHVALRRLMDTVSFKKGVSVLFDVDSDNFS